MKLLMILLCKATYAPVAPPFREQGDNAPVMQPRSGVLDRTVVQTPATIFDPAVI